MTKKAETGEVAKHLMAYLEEVKAGHEVLLMNGQTPVARLVPPLEPATPPALPPHIRSLKGHRVLTPVISQADLAEEMF